MERIKGTEIRINRANTFMKRFFGLMFTDEPPKGIGLMIEPCKSIHMYFMRYAIDVIVLDQKQHIIALYEGLQPRKVTPYLKNAASFIEFEESTIRTQGFALGQPIEFENVDEMDQ